MGSQTVLLGKSWLSQGKQYILLDLLALFSQTSHRNSRRNLSLKLTILTITQNAPINPIIRRCFHIIGMFPSSFPSDPNGMSKFQQIQIFRKLDLPYDGMEAPKQTFLPSFYWNLASVFDAPLNEHLHVMCFCFINTMPFDLREQKKTHFVKFLSLIWWLLNYLLLDRFWGNHILRWGNPNGIPHGASDQRQASELGPWHPIILQSFSWWNLYIYNYIHIHI